MLGLAASTVFGGMAVPRLAQAATYIVTNVNDSGVGSLRQAVLNANALAGSDTIAFAFSSPQTIVLTTGELAITDAVTIAGPGAAQLTVSGNAASRIFNIEKAGVPVPVDVTLNALTIANGQSIGAAGGCVRAAGENLSMDSVVITGCTTDSSGGGVYLNGNYGPALTITNSTITGNTAVNGGGLEIPASGASSNSVHLAGDTFSNNSAGSFGGGIDASLNNGSFTMTRSTVTGNQSGTVVGMTGSGGGMRLDGGNHLNSTVLIQDSTVSGNIADPGTTMNDVGYGGGVYFTQLALGVVDRSTITGNTGQVGGGVYLRSCGASGTPIAFQDDTIADNNLAVLALGAGARIGGGIYSNYSSVNVVETTIVGNAAPDRGGGVSSARGPMTLLDSIVANNTAPIDPDVSTTFPGTLSATYSLIRTPGTTTIGGGTGNVTGLDPGLGALALASPSDPTAVMVPGPTSPAINAGDPAFVAPPATDQRGFARVIDGRIDMGAVEVQSSNGAACPLSRANLCVSGFCIDGICAPATFCLVRAAVTDCPSRRAACPNPTVADTTACDDSNACTNSDGCRAGVCVGNPVVCTAPDACHVAGTCNASSGTCSAAPNAANGTACNDSNACTVGDACRAGVCAPGSMVSCPPPDDCHLAGVCNPGSGACSVAPKVDGTACSGGICEAGVCMRVSDAGTDAGGVVVADASTIDSGPDATIESDAAGADSASGAGDGSTSDADASLAVADGSIVDASAPGQDATSAMESGGPGVTLDASANVDGSMGSRDASGDGPARNIRDSAPIDGDQDAAPGTGERGGGGCGCKTAGDRGGPASPRSALAGLVFAAFALVRRRKGRAAGARRGQR